MLIFFSLIFLDQIFKIFVAKQFADTSSKIVLINNFLNITYAENTGIAFSALKNLNKYIIIFFVLFVIFLLSLFVFKKRAQYNCESFFVFILSGTMSNLLDRLVKGFVIDYIELSFFPSVFNLADVYIVIGAFLFIYFFIFKNKKIYLKKINKKMVK